MKTLVYQYFEYIKRNRDDPLGYEKLSQRSISSYAKKIKSDYKFISDPVPYHPMYGIFYPFITGLCHDYDMICFIDSDILATTIAKNVFHYASNEHISIHVMKGLEHGNSGTVVFPSATYNKFIKVVENLEDHFSRKDDRKNKKAPNWGGMDQQIINEVVLENKEYYNLSSEFNWHMSRKKWYPHKDRFNQSFIHYHGGNKIMIPTEFNDKRIEK